MKILSFIGALLLLLLKDTVIAAFISAFLCLLKWVGSLLSICQPPTWVNFMWGGIGVAALFFIPHLIKMTAHFITGDY